MIKPSPKDMPAVHGKAGARDMLSVRLSQLTLARATELSDQRDEAEKGSATVAAIDVEIERVKDALRLAAAGAEPTETKEQP